MTWPPNGPVTTHRLRAAIQKVPTFDPYPWYYTVDYVDPTTGRRDVSIDSLDYGSLRTHAEAVDAVCSILRSAD